jgi:hypothetical protein
MFARFALAFALLAGGFAGLQPAVAQDTDPPSRVARLNWIDGDVSFQPSGVDTWTGATINYPLTTGDYLYAAAGARAELHIGPNALRLNSETNFGFLNLDDHTAQIRLTAGSLEVRVRLLDDEDLYEIDAPQGAVSLLRTGEYRIDTDSGRNATMVTVLTGEAEVTSSQQAFVVHARQTAYFDDGGYPDIRNANPPDDFDQFTASRNSAEDHMPPAVHLSDAMPGARELNEYGDWRETIDFGWVWTPRVASDWAPYRYGEWTWEDPWGWTWIDEAPWGFAPFHYGRWAFFNGSWVWAPGPIAAPVYAPGLVVFVGGPQFGTYVSWFPLGPHEPFFPAYHVTAAYLRGVNYSHVPNIDVSNTNPAVFRYRNGEVPAAFTSVPRNAFTAGGPVNRRFHPLTRDEIANARVTGTAPPIAPTRENIAGTPEGRRVPTPPRNVMSRPVIVRNPLPAPPVGFAARQSMLDNNGGRPLAPEVIQQIRRQPGAAREMIPTRPTAVPPRPERPPVPPTIVTPAEPARRFEGPGMQRPAPGQPQPRPDVNRPLPEMRQEQIQPRAPDIRPVQPPPQIRQPRPDVNRPLPEMRQEQVQPRAPEIRPVQPPPQVHPGTEIRPVPAPRAPHDGGAHPEIK